MLRYLYDGTVKDFDDSQLTVLKVAKKQACSLPQAFITHGLKCVVDNRVKRLKNLVF